MTGRVVYNYHVDAQYVGCKRVVNLSFHWESDCVQLGMNPFVKASATRCSLERQIPASCCRARQRNWMLRNSIAIAELVI